MSQALRDNGFHVLETFNGRDALELANRHRGPIHLLVTDVILAGPMDGLELCIGLRRNRPDLRTLYVSAYSLDWDGRWEAEMGPEFFLAKPFAPKGLLEAVAFSLSEPKRDAVAKRAARAVEHHSTR
jgi:CheY-like chemotaxis protein